MTFSSIRIYASLLFFVVITLQTKLNAQCLGQLKAAYQKMKLDAENINTSVNTSYVNYTVRIMHRDSAAHPAVISTIEMWQQNKLIEIKSNEMLVYQDEKDAFMIAPSRKLISRSDAITRKKEKFDHFTSAIQDSLLKNGKISSCLSVKGGSYNQVITMDMDERMKSLIGISRCIYYLNTTDSSIKKVKMFYAENNNEQQGIYYVEYAINQLSYDYKDKKLSDNVQKKFMKTDKVLIEKYNNYQFIDNRVKKG